MCSAVKTSAQLLDRNVVRVRLIPSAVRPETRLQDSIIGIELGIWRFAQAAPE
jgi:hypothetical protein